jgi:hypothetical protein
MTVGQAMASIIPNPTDGGLTSAAVSGFGYSYLFDGNNFTDYAAAGPASTIAPVIIDMNFGAAYTFTSILYTDRTTSGGPGQGSSGLGVQNFATQVEYFFYDTTDTLIGNSGVINRAVPVSPTSYTAFQTLTALSTPVTAQYIEFEILATTNSPGNHPGADTFAFNVPEPSTGGLLLMGMLLGYWLVRRRRALQF